MEYKYIVLFPLPEPYLTRLNTLADKVAVCTGVQRAEGKLPLHATFHKPVVGIAENTLIDLTEAASLQITKTDLKVHGLSHFGKEFIVLPVQATYRLARLWIGLGELVRRLPEYSHGKHDDENTLHVTVAEGTTPVFNKAWPLVQVISTELMEIPINAIELHRKLEHGGVWERVRTFPLPASRAH